MPREYAHYDYGELVESIQFYLQIDRLSFANRHGIGCQARHLRSLNRLVHVPTMQCRVAIRVNCRMSAQPGPLLPYFVNLVRYRADL